MNSFTQKYTKFFIVGCSSLSLVAGLWFGFQGNKKALALTGVAGAIGGGVATIGLITHFNAGKTEDIQARIKKLKDDIKVKELSIKELSEKLGTVESAKKLLNQALDSEVSKYTELSEQTKKLTDENTQLLRNLKTVQSALTSTTTRVEELQAKVDELNTQITEDEKHYARELTEQARKMAEELARKEVKEWLEQETALLEEGYKLVLGAQADIKAVQNRNHELRSIIEGAANQVYGVVDGVEKRVQVEMVAAQEHISNLELKNRKLEQQLAGEILVPVRSTGLGYYHSIANRLIDTIFTEQQVVVAFQGLEEKDGYVNIGLGYSKSAESEAIAQTIKNNAKEWCKAWGIYALENIGVSPIYPAITITARRDQPVKVEASAICRSQDEFKKLIKSSRIFYRIMGKPEAGKSPLTLILISWIIESGMKEFNTGKGRVLPHTLVEFCNPLKGKSKKTSGDFESFYRWNDFDQAYCDLKSEYNFRGQLSNENYKDNVGYVWVCDEFDNGIRKAEGYSSTDLLSIFSDGGHLNVGAILLGQGVNVSKAKIQGEDIKMTTNIVLDVISMRAFLDKYGDLFYDSKTIDEARTTIDQLEEIKEEKNKYIVDTARKFRYCMVCLDRSPVFYQMPYFDQYDLEALNLEDRKEAIETLRRGEAKPQAVWTEIQHPSELHKPAICCKHCGSTKFEKHSRVKDVAKHRYLCLNVECGKTFVADKLTNSN